MRVACLICLLALALLVPAGCTGGSAGGGATSAGAGPTGTVTIVHTSPAARAGVAAAVVPDEVDTLEFRGYDAAGQQVYGWTRRAFSPLVVLGDVPRSVRRLRIDYLRNAGFALRRADVGVDVATGSAQVIDPPHAPAPVATSAWTIVSTGTDAAPSFTLNVEVSGLPAPAPSPSPSPFPIKGICYSPCPINDSNSAGPKIGDFFWDDVSGTGYDIKGWDVLWDQNSDGVGRHDLEVIRSLGANCIRIYSLMSRHLTDAGGFPSPPSQAQEFTHQKFLDRCWNNGNDPLYVLVGLPVGQAEYWSPDTGVNPDPGEMAFWSFVVQDTATQVGSHPAVMGFTVQNELDSCIVTYDNPDNPCPPSSGSQDKAAVVNYFWSQAQLYSGLAKGAAPTKLVGMATHEDPNIPTYASSQMALYGNDIDYWGVNSYQPQNFSSIESTYTGLAGATKPVIITEWGMPATGHTSSSDPSTIYEDANTRARAAYITQQVVPQAYTSSLLLGLFYFEFCDEWWNQGGSPNIYTWYGGFCAPGFPNCFWDQDGFGLFSVSRGGTLADDAPTYVEVHGDSSYQQPNLPLDVHTARTELTGALWTAFSAVPPAPSTTPSPLPSPIPSPSPSPCNCD